MGPRIHRVPLALLAGLLDTPLRIYSGHLAGADAALALGRQAVWVIVLAAIGLSRLTFTRALDRAAASRPCLCANEGPVFR